MPSARVDHVLSLPPDQLGVEVAWLDEDQWYERKSARIKPKALAVPLIALANAEGGTVVIGIADDGTLDGQAITAKQLNAWRQSPMTFSIPPVKSRFEELEAVSADGTGHRLLVIRVEPGEVVHEHTDGSCYLRVGDQSRKLGFLQRQELHFDRGAAKYDGQAIPGQTLSDLDPAQVAAYTKAVGTRQTADDLLRARGLLTTRGDVTVAGYLLFAEHPQTHMPHAHVRVLRYRGTERGTGSRMLLDAGADERVDGSLPHQITIAADIIRRWIPARRALTSSGIFEDIPIVPQDAWLEGLVNAVTHRSYSLAGDHVRVEIFEDRLEIESPGRFPGLVDPGRPLDIDRYARNPRVARVLADLGVTRELGEGIKRMFDEMKANGLTDPFYRQSSSAVRLVLRAASRLDPEVRARLPRGAAEIVDVMREVGRPLSTGEIVELTRASRPTVNKRLASLRDEGLVTWNGTSPKDPRASWSLAPSL